MGFNPPPAVRPGGTDRRHRPRAHCGFNPPPAVRPGETWVQSAARQSARVRPGELAAGMTLGFNPPPAVRPGGTVALPIELTALAFQSAPGGEAGGNMTNRDCQVHEAVSIRPRR